MNQEQLQYQRKHQPAMISNTICDGHPPVVKNQTIVADSAFHDRVHRRKRFSTVPISRAHISSVAPPPVRPPTGVDVALGEDYDEDHDESHPRKRRQPPRRRFQRRNSKTATMLQKSVSKFLTSKACIKDKQAIEEDNVKISLTEALVEPLKEDVSSPPPSNDKQSHI